jgi:hypothetical protein
MLASFSACLWMRVTTSGFSSPNRWANGSVSPLERLPVGRLRMPVSVAPFRYESRCKCADGYPAPSLVRILHQLADDQRRQNASHLYPVTRVSVVRSNRSGAGETLWRLSLVAPYKCPADHVPYGSRRSLGVRGVILWRPNPRSRIKTTSSSLPLSALSRY